jgi:hypothetical protein
VTRRMLMSSLFACMAGATILGQALPAHADRVVSDVTIPFDFFVSNSCTASSIHLIGTRRFVTTEHVTSSGQVHFCIRTISEGTGQDSVSGTAYFLKGQSLEIQNIAPDSFPGTFTLTDHFHAISPGPEANFVVNEVFHVTTNANGETTGFTTSSTSTDCK